METPTTIEQLLALIEGGEEVEINYDLSLGGTLYLWDATADIRLNPRMPSHCDATIAVNGKVVGQGDTISEAVADFNQRQSRYELVLPNLHE